MQWARRIISHLLMEQRELFCMINDVWLYMQKPNQKQVHGLWICITHNVFPTKTPLLPTSIHLFLILTMPGEMNIA